MSSKKKELYIEFTRFLVRPFFVGSLIFWQAFSLPLMVLAEEILIEPNPLVDTATVETVDITETSEVVATDTSVPQILEITLPTISELSTVATTSTTDLDALTASSTTLSESETTIDPDLTNVPPMIVLPDLEEMTLSPASTLDFENDNVKLDLPENISEEILINSVLTLRDAPLRFSFENIISTATPKTRNGFVVYEDVFLNTDVEYKITENGLKENIVLKDVGHPDKFVYDINLVEYDFEIEENILKIYEKGKVGQKLFLLYEIRAPYMTDRVGNVSTSIKLEVLDNKLVVTPDQQWIKNASYPIVVDPIFEISVLNLHSHPIEGENWNVDFTTVGVGDLYIRPADQATIDEDEFEMLRCGLDDRTSNAQILEGDVIFYPNWSCDEVATVSHLTLVTGHHHLVFEFGNEEESAVAEAFNAAISWDGGAGTSNWEDDANWSGDVEPGSADDVTIATAVTVNINTATTIQSLTLGVVGGGTASVLNFAYAGTTSPLTINNNLTVYSGASVTHSVGTAAVVGSIGLTVGGSAQITGSVTASEKGFSAGNGPGVGTSNAGGSYGGRSGPHSNNILTGTGIGSTYGSTTKPIDLGSAGSASGGDGSGGGAIKMNVTGTLTVSGSIVANGKVPTGGVYGGGSGGSIYLTTGTLAGSGTISANGATGGGPTGFSVGGAGGGGRIAIYYTTDSSTITYAASGAYSAFGGRSIGGAGTIFKKATSQSYGDLIVDNDSVQGVTTEETQFATSTPIIGEYDSLTIRDTASVYVGTTYATATTITMTGNGEYQARSGTTLVYTTLNWTAGIITDAGGTFAVLNQNQNLTIPASSKLVMKDFNNARTYNDVTISGTLSHFQNVNATTTTSDIYRINYTVNGNLTIGSGGSVNVNAKGYIGSRGPGGGVASGVGGGASHGGVGGVTSGGVAASSTNGSITNPTDLGSGGGIDTDWSGVSGGGIGGGAVKFVVSGTASITGTISANSSSAGDNTIYPYFYPASPGCFQHGGGSGGSVYISAATFSGSGTITANGADACDSSGGSGSGGRIALYYTTDSSSWTVRAFGTSASYAISGAGTIYKKSAAQTYGEVLIANNDLGGSTETSFGRTPLPELELDILTIRNSGSTYFTSTYATATTLTLSSNGHYTATSTSRLYYTTLNWAGIITDQGGVLPIINDNQSLTVPSGATLVFGMLNSSSRTYTDVTVAGTLSHTANLSASTATATTSLYKLIYTITGNLTVSSGGAINVDSKGYSADDGWGAGTSVGNHNYGASHGGLGSGSSSGSTPGPIYGSTTTPVDLGSGGGSNASPGGSGGGAVILTVTGTTTVNGAITANGGNGATPGGLSGTSGGGSGGSIYLTTGSLTGSSNITANGGNGASWFGTAGGGGGGRIATIFTATTTASVLRTVNGGTGNTTAANGTLYPPNAPTFTTDAVSSIRDITATGNASVTARGYYYQSQHGFVIATTSTPTITNYDAIVQLGATSTALGSFTGSITGLTASTTYYVRAYFSTTTAVYGNTVTFDSASSTAFIQSQYRFYANLDALQPTTALAAQNATSTVYSTSSPVRLRVNTSISLLSLLASSQSFILQMSTSSFNWLNVSSSTNWWNEDWTNRRKITFDNSAATENLTNFPVAVHLKESLGNIDYTKTQNSGQDIRFVDANGTTTLSYEIEKWDETATSTIWVKVPQIDSGSATDYIWMYYNNPDAVDGQNASGVWDSNYALVYHMAESSGATTNDSTTRNNDGTKTSSTEPVASTTGAVGNAYDFDGSNDAITVTSVSGLSGGNAAITMEMWIKPDAVSGARAWIAQLGNEGNGSFHWLYNTNQTTGFGAWGCGSCQYAPSLSLDVWTHILITSDGTTLRGYKNGVQESTATGSFSIAGIPLSLGLQHLGESYFNGTLDEVRISNSVRSASWVLSSYKAMINTFNTYASEDTVSEPVMNFYNNTSVASGTAISATLLTGSNVLGAYTESNPTAVNPFEALLGELVEWDFTLDLSSLDFGENYYFRMVEGDGTTFSSYTNLAVLSVSEDNLAPTAGSLSASNVTTASITVSISGASDAESGLSATPYIFYASNGASSGATAQTSWTFNGLNAGVSYDFYATVTDNEDNVGTTATISQTTTANSSNSGYNNNGSGGGTTLYYVKINNGAATTTNRLVNLTFAAPAQTERILISATSSFSSNTNIAYSTSSPWYLCNLGSPCFPGIYKVFARYLDKKNKILTDVWSSIYYSDIPISTSPPTSPPTPTLPPEANPPVIPPGQEKKEPPVIPPIEPPIPEDQSFEVSILGSLSRKKNQNWVSLLEIPINSKVSFKIESITDLSGRYTYEVDCDSDGVAERTYDNTLRKIYFARNTCLFTKEGVYTVSLKAFNSGQLATATMTVIVGSPVMTPPPLPPTPTTTPPTTPPNNPPPPENGVENGEGITDVVYSDVVVPVVDYGNLAVAFIIDNSRVNQLSGIFGAAFGGAAELLLKLSNLRGHLLPITLGVVGAPLIVMLRTILARTVLGGLNGFVAFLTSILHQILTLLHLRKRRRFWGTVYDSETKQPIDPAVVSLFDTTTSKKIEEVVTDLYGRYGFLDHIGRFKIVAQKTHYQFPSLKVMDRVDGMYQDVYHGEELLVSQASDVIRPNIPMDATQFDWNQEAKQEYVRFHPILDAILSHLLRVLGAFTLLLSATFAIGDPGFVSIATLLISGSSFFVDYFIPVGRLWGRVKGLPSDMKAQIILQPEGLANVIVGRSRIDADGRYFLKSAPGDFILKIRDTASLRDLYIREVSVGKSGVVNEIIRLYP